MNDDDGPTTADDDEFEDRRLGHEYYDIDSRGIIYYEHARFTGTIPAAIPSYLDCRWVIPNGSACVTTPVYCACM